MEKITTYHLSDNVCDLEKAIQRVMILISTGVIQTENLPIHIRGYEQSEPVIHLGDESIGNIKEVNAQVEKELIKETLKKYNNNRTLTAEHLQLSRNTLFKNETLQIRQLNKKNISLLIGR